MRDRRYIHLIFLAMFILSGCGGKQSQGIEDPADPAPFSNGGSEIPPSDAASGLTPPDAGDPTDPIRDDTVRKNPIPVTITLRTQNLTVAAGATARFEAEVSGVAEPEIVWSIREWESGGSIGEDGTYLAPAEPGLYHIIARLEIDPELSAETTVEVIPFEIKIDPPAVKTYPGRQEAFAATVPGISDPGVAWSIKEARGGSITAEGVYTAPPTAGLFHIVATSRTEPTKTASAPVTVEWPISTVPRFAYVANSDSNDVSMYRVDSETGRLDKIGDIAAGLQPFAVAADPAGRFVYAGNFGSNDLSIYRIDPETGSLISLGEVETGSGPYSVVAHPSGRYLYVATENSTSNLDTWTYEIDPATGRLKKLETVSAGISPIAITLDRFGKFGYVANASSGNIAMYQVEEETGLLRSLGLAPAGNGANSVVVHPTGKFAYVANYGGNDVWAYQKDDQGILKKIGAEGAGVQPFSIAVDPSGRFVYVANSGTDDVWMYRIDPETGGLKTIGAVAGGITPRSITADPSGKFVYIANHCCPTV